ncbi:MAG: alpha/beta hydrolase [Hyphomicrobiaceae bacterium]|nr:alpha/beta hydrolase [Hyphomicrobiaceae bacterium]
MALAFGDRLAGIRHRLRTPDGVELEVREFGDPNGPELLLVPGVAQSYLSFIRQFDDPALQHFRIVSYDPRGHGLSGKPSGEEWYRGRRWSDEVRTVMEGVGLRKPVLLGWSLGGRIVRQYLVDYGDDRLSGLVFLSCRPVELPEFVGPGNKVLESISMQDLGSRIDVAAQFLRNCFERQPDPAEFEFMLAYNMLCPFEIRQQIGGWWTEPSISSDALRRVEVPTLVVHGARDILVLPDAAKATADLVPGSHLSIYDDCGHSVFFEAASDFNVELADFVTDVIASSKDSTNPVKLRGRPA